MSSNKHLLSDSLFRPLDRSIGVSLREFREFHNFALNWIFLLLESVQMPIFPWMIIDFFHTQVFLQVKKGFTGQQKSETKLQLWWLNIYIRKCGSNAESLCCRPRSCYRKTSSRNNNNIRQKNSLKSRKLSSCFCVEVSLSLLRSYIYFNFLQVRILLPLWAIDTYFLFDFHFLPTPSANYEISYQICYRQFKFFWSYCLNLHGVSSSFTSLNKKFLYSSSSVSFVNA